jgi:hypothetical protein
VARRGEFSHKPPPRKTPGYITAEFNTDVLKASTKGVQASHRTMRRYKENEVDYFAISCPQLNELYGIPLADAKVTASLRVEAAANKQEKYIRWAKDYSWEKHIAELRAEWWRERDLNSRPTGYESVALTS